MWENKPKNKPATNSINVKSIFGKTTKLIKNTGMNINNNFLFKNRKLKSAIKIPISK